MTSGIKNTEIPDRLLDIYKKFEQLEKSVSVIGTTCADLLNNASKCAGKWTGAGSLEVDGNISYYDSEASGVYNFGVMTIPDMEVDNESGSEAITIESLIFTPTTMPTLDIDTSDEATIEALGKIKFTAKVGETSYEFVLDSSDMSAKFTFTTTTAISVAAGEKSTITFTGMSEQVAIPKKAEN